MARKQTGTPGRQMDLPFGGRAVAPRALARCRPWCGCAGVFRPAGRAAGGGDLGCAAASAAGRLAGSASATGGLGAGDGRRLGEWLRGRRLACRPPASRDGAAADRDHRHRAGAGGRICCQGPPADPRRGAARRRSGRSPAHPPAPAAARIPARPQPGDLVRVRALLRAPAPPAYPGAWDFQQASWFSGLGASGFAIAEAEDAAGEAPAPAFAAMRAGIEARVLAALPGPNGAVSAALLTGGQSAIAARRPGRNARFRAGASAQRIRPAYRHRHGAQFQRGPLAAGLAALVRAAATGEGPAALAALGSGGFYLLLSGSQVPMQRSFATAAVATLALLAGRRALTLRASPWQPGRCC